MRDPSWMGHAPTDVRWSLDGRSLYFDWNPNPTPGDSTHVWEQVGGGIRALTPKERQALPSNRLSYSPDRTRAIYARYGDLFLVDAKGGKIRQLTATVDRESNPTFDLSGEIVYYTSDDNFFSLDLNQGTITQLSDFRYGAGPEAPGNESRQRTWLEQEEGRLMQVLTERSQSKQTFEQERDLPKTHFVGRSRIENLAISPDGRFITCRLSTSPSQSNRTQVPNYVVSSGYTEEIPARAKVGSPQDTYEFLMYDREQDSMRILDISQVEGIYDLPAYQDGYLLTSRSQEESGQIMVLGPREIMVKGPIWSPDGMAAIVEMRSLDFKDRWLSLLDPSTGELISLDRQHDEAWIGGPGINRWLGASSEIGWMPDNEHVWFISEQSGYAHLYTVNIRTGLKRALTSGNFEVSDVRLSEKGRYWYFSSSETHPGERHFYRLPVKGGEPQQITSMTGRNEVTLSPDERYLAIRYSYSNKPWELFIQENKPGAKVQQITNSVSEEFLEYDWRDPEVVTFRASDGESVYARLYRPERAKAGGPAVIFVHGAGYLQNAHKWWSSYFREYMFHNLLVDHGYTVLDIDYRGSAGYGRDWRTGVYRHMGGLDLSDHVDGLQYLVSEHQVDPARVGIYGGSYGGFITLMALFTEPGVFAAGAALRPVTDWAHYNHPYTASMLNNPQDDSLAYVRSSPIYHAEGLEDPLLICHGMVDVNVHFQDVVRLSQRLIELGKKDWSVAFYPMEGHGFREPSSWTDEYTRIYQLFEQHVK